MRQLLLVVSFSVSTLLLLSLSLFMLPSVSGSGKLYSQNQNFGTTIVANRSYQTYTALPQVLGAFDETQIKANDARPALVESFLHRYNSPFVGAGDFIVQMADKYKIPYGLVPAIAQCESNVGKVIPEDSYNAWGYGIYGTSVLHFNNWFQAIETVSRGLRHDYFDYGLDTPEKIMKKYTPPSNGSWSRCVNEFMSELE